MKIACGWLYTLNRYGYPPSFQNTLAGISQASAWGFNAFEMEAIGEENLKMLWANRRELKAHVESRGLTRSAWTQPGERTHWRCLRWGLNWPHCWTPRR